MFDIWHKKEFPHLKPVSSEPYIRSLQNFMLEQAESKLGQREVGKIIYPPQFHEDPESKPCIVNSMNLDGAWSCLSVGSKTNWECAYYEIAHETVHLLNPVVGNTNYLEEGIAVVFAEEMLKFYGIPPINIKCPYYKKARELANQLPGDTFEAAKKIRAEYHSLGAVSSEDLISLFPSLNNDIAIMLCKKCDFGEKPKF